MRLWHAQAVQKLRVSGLFTRVELSGGDVRAFLSESRFLDIHFDPTTCRYSYAMIDLTLPYAGDKRLFGWDDFPHPNSPELHSLPSHPHHYPERRPNGAWMFLDVQKSFFHSMSLRAY
ncbi:MAG: hypothetical protein EHM81_09040 [Chloroflexi bacterium]|nr:MAG: hypothetical protein EHM81_09040 [Chloroflexota bacterium]